jgi:hypothetical protein
MPAVKSAGIIYLNNYLIKALSLGEGWERL